jgi:hypothetical protein
MLDLCSTKLKLDTRRSNTEIYVQGILFGFKTKQNKNHKTKQKQSQKTKTKTRNKEFLDNALPHQ